MVPVELATGGANTILVVSMLCCIITASIGISNSNAFTCTVCGGRSIYLTFTCTEYSRNRVGICTNILYPADLALVAV